MTLHVASDTSAEKDNNGENCKDSNTERPSRKQSRKASLAMDASTSSLSSLGETNNTASSRGRRSSNAARAGTEASLDQMWDFFMCHSQKTGGDQVHGLVLELNATNYTTWYDQTVVNVTTRGMELELGVRNSSHFVLFLSRGVLSRPFCLIGSRGKIKSKVPPACMSVIYVFTHLQKSEKLPGPEGISL